MARSNPELFAWDPRINLLGTGAVMKPEDARRQTETAQADTAWLVAAGLLHDVGKTSAQLGVIGRSAATVLELLGVGSAPGRLGRYLHYPVAGAAALQRAGSDPRVVAWAGEHHLGAARWTVPASAGELLARADRDA